MKKTRAKSKGQKGAEAKVEGFRQNLGPFVVAAETTRMPMVFTDAREPGHPIVFANDSLLALTGYDREGLLGQGIDVLLAGAGEAETAGLVDAAFDAASGSELEVRCRRKDGGLFWAAIIVSPVRDEAGNVLQHFASLVDLTRHMQEEDHLRFLLDELNHRTQNTLATVQAIAVQTLRGHAAPDVVEAFQGRILALSKAHRLLGRENWNAVSLRDLLDQILQPFGLDRDANSHFTVEGPIVHLPPKTALTFAVVFHELATNAAKYGALSNNAVGQIDISWQIEVVGEADRLRLVWREIGGPPVSPPSRRGFGSRLIERGLAQELNGEVKLDYLPAGLVCRIVMPLEPWLGERA